VLESYVIALIPPILNTFEISFSCLFSLNLLAGNENSHRRNVNVNVNGKIIDIPALLYLKYHEIS
jgi:hypothetical protein